MSDTTYTASEIADKTGAKLRQLLLWADAGAIQAVPATSRAGSGVHRRFAWPEVHVAAILTAASAFRLPIGVMVQIGDSVRNLLVLSIIPAEDLIEDVPMTLHGRMGSPWKINGGAAKAAELLRQAASGETADIELVITPAAGGFEYSMQYVSTRPTHGVALVLNLGMHWKGLVSDYQDRPPWVRHQ